MYFGDVIKGRAYKAILEGENENFLGVLEQAIEIKPSVSESIIKVVGSRSHLNEDTFEFIENLKKDSFQSIELVPKGSSLKFCLVAEGIAQLYPSFAPTMEWDTAAGQIICEAVGLSVTSRLSGKIMLYNKDHLLNDHFLVSSND